MTAHTRGHSSSLSESAERPAIYWPAFIDLLSVTLMVFVLVSFLENTLFAHETKLLLIQEKQRAFADDFRAAFGDRSGVDLKFGLDDVLVTFDRDILFVSGEYRFDDGPPRDAALPAGLPSSTPTTSTGESSPRDLLRKLAGVVNRSCDDRGELARCSRVQVEGHTDNVPISSRSQYVRNNWDLSTLRATSVLRFLIEHGAASSALSENRFSASGYGEFRPAQTNDTVQGRAANRRIEVRVEFAVQDDIPGAPRAEAPS